MPYCDGTGPFGQGPMGRGLGPCGAGRRSCFSSGFGGGFRGFGNFRSGLNRPRWGWGYGGGGQAMPQDEVQALKQEASYLQNELDVVQKRLAELEGA